MPMPWGPCACEVALRCKFRQKQKLILMCTSVDFLQCFSLDKKTIENAIVKMGENVALPSGLFPVMLTPFCDDGGVDFAGLAKLTNWYIASGAVGLFGAFSSSAALPRPAPSSTHSLTNYCYCLPPFCSRSAEL